MIWSDHVVNHGVRAPQSSLVVLRMALKLAAGALALLAAPAVAHPWYVQSNPNGELKRPLARTVRGRTRWPALLLTAAR